MSELEHDPFASAIELDPEITTHREFFVSLPLTDRYNQYFTWRRIVEGSCGEAEFASDLAVLNDFRAAGFVIPPYTAAVEMWEDDEPCYVLYVGHIEGKHFNELDLHDTVVQEDYEDLGLSLLRYISECTKGNKPYLTDLTKVDQYIYGRNNSMFLEKPILIDLELHTSKSSSLDLELPWFVEDFLNPLESAMGKQSTPLRDSINNLAIEHGIQVQFLEV